MNSDSFDRIIVAGAAIATLYFSYIPLIFLINSIDVDKLIPFIALVSLVGTLMLVRFVMNPHLELGISSVVVVLLYGLFASFGLIRYFVLPAAQGSGFSLVVLMLVNPLFIVFALFSRGQKALVLRLVLVFSAVYVVLMLNAAMSGTYGPVAKNIFIVLGIEGLFYQNASTYIGLFIVSSIYFYMIGSRWKWPLMALSVLSLLGMLLVGGRAAFIAVIAVLCVQGVRAIRNGWLNKFPKWLLPVVFLMLIIASVFITNQYLELIKSMSLVRRFTILLGEGDTSLRFFLFGSAIELWLSDPATFLFGSGLGSYPMFIGESGTGWYPHNIVLELLAEFGTVGCVLFFLPIAYSVWKSMSSRLAVVEGKPEEWVIFLVAIYHFILANFTGGLSSSWVFLYFVYLILPAARRKVRTEESRCPDF